MAYRLSFRESPVNVRVGEQLVWSFDAAPWGTSPTSVSVEAIRLDTGADVTSTIFPSGSPSVAGNVITLPLAQGWEADITYRITVQFTANGNRFRPYADLMVVA